jgi:MFS family permease
MTSTTGQNPGDTTAVGKSRDGVLHNRDFLKLWGGETVSLIGTQITEFTLPLVALLTLGATAFEVGLLNGARYAPVVLVSLFAGVWLDQVRRRPVLVNSNLSRAILIGLVPLAAVTGFLSMELLYVVAITVGALTVVFDVGILSYLPGLVDRRHLVDANSKLQTSFALAGIVGPGLAGLLVGLLDPPVVLAFQTGSLTIAAVLVMLIRKPEPRPAVSADRPSVAKSIAEGLHTVFGDRMLRALLTQSATFNLFQNAVLTVFVVYAVRELRLSPMQLGIVVGSFSVGALFGALVSNRLRLALGFGRALLVVTVMACLSQLLLLTATGSDPLSISLLVAALLVFGVNLAIYNVNTLTLRQSVTPNRLLARMNASYRLILFGAAPLGAVLGGTLAELVGLRSALVIAVIGVTTPLAWIFFSPVFRLKDIPAAPVEPSGSDAPEASQAPSPAPAGNDVPKDRGE